MIFRRYPIVAGLGRHLWLTLALNFRSKQAVAYGYVMPILFVVGFAGIFRSDTPPLAHEMGQLLTITILGSACIGMPTAMVADRERGMWRRYRLLPAGTASLVASTLAARFVLILLSALLQIVFARLAFGTPWPAFPAQLAAGFCFVAFAFLGLGLLITALAKNVPAVQALAQCIFLPMIMIGGVGVPLAALPLWARRVAGFLPGRYSVEVLHSCFSGPHGLHGMGFSLAALLVIGAAGVVAGARLFHWDTQPRADRLAWAWIALALSSWAGVGVAAAATGRLVLLPDRQASGPVRLITDQQIDAISLDGLPPDYDVVTPLAPPQAAEGSEWMERFSAKLDLWPPGREADVDQSVRNLVSVAAVADLEEDPMEGTVARVVWDKLRLSFHGRELSHALARIVLYPKDGTVISGAPELDLPGALSDSSVRDRDALYAKKFLGRVIGKIPD